MLHFDLVGMMRRREIENPYRFLVKNGFNYHTARHLLRNERDSLSYKNLEKLCLLLHCTPNDLFVWQKPTDAVVAENHPLHQLKPKPQEVNIMQKLQELPLDKLELVKQFVKELPEE
ncbi:MAG: helix-turn-helix domain-containing protein [Saprospiraceae bacterium]